MLKIPRMRIPVFVSAPSPDNLSPAQEESAKIIHKLVARYKLEWRALGRSDYPNDLPLKEVLKMVEHCSGGIILGFEQFRTNKGVFKPGSPKSTEIKNVRYPTIWNQLEAAMAFGLKKPLFVILEEGLHQEAMLKDRLEYRALVTPLNVNFFKTDEFKGVFVDWTRIALAHTAKSAKSVDPVGLTVRQILENLKPGELWKVLAVVLTLLSGVASAGYWIGKNLSESPNTAKTPALVQPSKAP